MAVPINLPYIKPQSSGWAEGLNSIADTLTEAARQKQARDRQAADILLGRQRLELERQQTEAQNRRADELIRRDQEKEQRQQKVDAANALPQISHLLDPNTPDYNPELAQSLAKIHGFDFHQTNAVPKPEEPGAAPQAPDAPTFVGPIDTPEHAALTHPSPLNALTQAAAGQGHPQQPDPSLAPLNGQPVEGPRLPNIAQNPAAQEAIRQQAERDQYAQQLAQHSDLMAAHAASVDKFKAEREQYRQAQANPQYQGTGPFGPISFAPAAMQQGADNRASGIAQRMRAYADSLNDSDPERAGRVRGLAGAADARLLDEKTAMTLLEKELARDQAGKLAGDKNATALQIAELRRRKGGGGDGLGARYNRKQEAANEKALGRIEGEVKDFEGKHGLEEVGKSYTEARRALDKLNASNDPATQIGVLDAMVKSNTGGKATLGQIRVALEHLGGLDAQVEGWLEGKGTGGLGAAQVANIKKALQATVDATGQEINGLHDSWVKSHYTGSLYNEKGNWENAEERLFGRFGMHPRLDPNAPTIVPGSGRHAKATAGVNAQSNALVQAAKLAQLPEADRKAAKWALSHRGDPQAEEILKHNGL